MRKPPETSPNILFVICDDLGFGDLGCYGNPIVRTPNLDAMASAGVRLTRVCSGPLCTPARASLLTGRYPYRTRAIDTYLGRSMVDPSERTLGHVFSAAGYRTGLFGKWHLGDHYPMRPMEMGFDRAVYHTGGGLEQPANIGQASYFDPDLHDQGERREYTGYCTDVFTNEALKFIGEKSNAPWLAYVAFNAPHVPLHIGEEWVEFYRSQGVAEENARLYGMVENIDWNMGRLFAELGESGALENTVVVFTSDHGPIGIPRFNAGLRGHKGTLYEGGLRVPCLVRGPGVSGCGESTPVLAGPIDWLPTLADLAGIPVSGKKLDGITLRPWLQDPRGEGEFPDRRLFYQWHRGDTPELRRNAAVISQRYKLLWDQCKPPCLFDLENDPGEQAPLAPEEFPLAAEFEQEYLKWFGEVSTEYGESTFLPPRIVVGDSHEPLTHLTWQDWRLYEPVRENEWWCPEMPGYWMLHIAHTGLYRVVLVMPENAGGTLTLRCGKFSVEQTAVEFERVLSWEHVELDEGDANLEACVVSPDGLRRGMKQVRLSRSG